jgi:hypothetical protein
MHPLAQKIAAEIAEENGFSFDDMVNDGKRRRIVSYARFEAMARIRSLTQPNGKAMFSLILIGRWFGTDHTTVHHATTRYDQAVAALAEYRRLNPVGEIPNGAMKRSGVETGLATYVKALAEREERSRPEPEPEPTACEKHVEAILAQRPEGFEAHREVYRKQTRFGIHRTLLPRTYRPLVDPDDVAWWQGLVQAA